MPIHVPGVRTRRGRAKAVQRNAIAVLQLTAMVDMFTVMVVFLLQNYATTDQILPLPDIVELPKAQSTQELKPSNVVVVSDKIVSVNNVQVASFLNVKEQEDWLIEPLRIEVERVIEEGQRRKAAMGTQIRQTMLETRSGLSEDVNAVDDFRKMTIQADKKIDFLSVKKVMYTLTEAGIYEINFAVIERPKETL